MIGAAIGAAASAVGSILGGAAARRKEKKAEKMLAQQQKDNEAWYSKEANQRYTAGDMYALTMGRKLASERLAQARGANAVMGGGEENLAATKMASAEAEQNALGQMAAQRDARVQAANAQYLQTRNAIQGQQIANLQNQAQQSAMAGSQVMQAGMGLAGADIQASLDTGRGLFESWFSKRQK